VTPVLVSLKELLTNAAAHHHCIMAFNICNFETAHSVLNAAQKLDSPVILAFGERSTDYIPLEFMSLTVNALVKDYTVPLVFHLDHASGLQRIQLAVQSGFTSIMFDGSRLPFEENISVTRKVVEIAHQRGISVEAELGYVTEAKQPHSQKFEIKHNYTNPDEARSFISQTNVDALAISIGNIHGLRASKRKNVQLDFDLLEKLKESCEAPLVLHGGSGVSWNDLRRAVHMGISKLNINTELSTSAVDEIRRVLGENDSDLRFEDLMMHVREAIEKTASQYIKAFTLG
jgi:ketose-bisphosphate aldolase